MQLQVAKIENNRILQCIEALKIQKQDFHYEKVRKSIEKRIRCILNNYKVVLPTKV